ncbi:WD40_repeat protein [Hexamita inflata]|uniref:WD40 repeat protein n=1 Tax=Hexamita inflata TaxID=28002 RepID=A0AA86QL55_9EUKA|nr:WD40 repeat protein [Hexamita inflata]
MKLTAVLTAHRGPVTSVKIHNGQILSASADGTVAVFSNPQRPTYSHRLFGHTTRGLSSIHPLGDTVLLGADDKATLVHIATNSLLQQYTNSENVSSVHQQQHVVFTASADGSVRQYERLSGTQLAIFRGHESAVLCVESKEQLIISGGQDGRVVFYNVNGITLHTLRLSGPVSDLKLNLRGDGLVVFVLGVGVLVFKLDLIQLKNTKLVRTFNVLEKRFLHQIEINTRKIVFGGQGRVAQFDLVSGQVEELVIENDDILCVCSAGGVICAGGRSGRVWIIE